MIGQRVRMLRPDGPLKAGWEGFVEKTFETSVNHNKKTPWYVRWVDEPKFLIPTYQEWFEVVDQQPDEIESFFV